MEDDDLDFDGVNGDEIIKDYEKKAHEKFLATSFLLGGCLDTYGDMITNLENVFLKVHYLMHRYGLE